MREMPPAKYKLPLERRNKLCPYLTIPLVEVKEISKEHILPIGIGAPESFFVQAALSENNRLNDLIDAPMLNDPVTKMLCMFTKVKTRSGYQVSTLHGETALGGDFTATVTNDDVRLKFNKPVEKNLETGEIMIKGFDESVFEHAEEVARNIFKKGKKTSQDINIFIENDYPIEMSAVSDMMLFFREAIKIAYLFTVKAYGDFAIDSRSGEIFRSAIEAKNDAEMRASQMRWCGIPHDHYESFMKLQPKHHMLFTSLDDEFISTQVVIFGGIGFHFRTPRGDISIKNCSYGKIIDASRQCFVDRPED